MINPAYVHTMAAYNAEMNRRWYAAAAKLSDDQRRQDRGAFFGSLHGTLCHLVWTDRIWMSRFAGWERPPGTLKDSPTFIAAFDDLRAVRVRQDADIAAWAGTVSQEWLDGDLTWFSGANNMCMTMPIARLIMHMFNHQTHHRGQAHALLTAHGQDPGGTDLHIAVQ